MYKINYKIYLTEVLVLFADFWEKYFDIIMKRDRLLFKSYLRVRLNILRSPHRGKVDANLSYPISLLNK